MSLRDMAISKIPFGMHIVTCEKLTFPPTTWEVAIMIVKWIIEKASA